MKPNLVARGELLARGCTLEREVALTTVDIDTNTRCICINTHTRCIYIDTHTHEHAVSALTHIHMYSATRVQYTLDLHVSQKVPKKCPLQPGTAPEVSQKVSQPCTATKVPQKVSLQARYSHKSLQKSVPASQVQPGTAIVLLPAQMLYFFHAKSGHTCGVFLSTS